MEGLEPSEVEPPVYRSGRKATTRRVTTSPGRDSPTDVTVTGTGPSFRTLSRYVNLMLGRAATIPDTPSPSMSCVRTRRAGSAIVYVVLPRTNGSTLATQARAIADATAMRTPIATTTNQGQRCAATGRTRSVGRRFRWADDRVHATTLSRAIAARYVRSNATTGASVDQLGSYERFDLSQRSASATLSPSRRAYSST